MNKGKRRKRLTERRKQAAIEALDLLRERARAERDEAFNYVARLSEGIAVMKFYMRVHLISTGTRKDPTTTRWESLP